MRILGLISGTSHDGVDAAIVDFAEEPHGAGTRLVATVLFHDSTPYDPGLRTRIVAALPPTATTLAEVARLDTRIGQAFAAVARSVIATAGPVDLIVSHGQTVYHWTEGAAVLGTLQIGQPAWIAEATGVPVLADIRIRDITAGGQGAPLASTMDAMLLAGRGGRPAALNLGGISNATIVAEDGVRAWDIGPANALMDAVVLARRADPRGYDAGGALAAAGTADPVLLAALLEEPYYRLAAPKSTGKELFRLDYVEAALARTSREAISTEDLLATLAELTVRTVIAALAAERITELFVSGGGVHNPVVMSGLAAGLPGVPVRTTDALGLGADEKEAVLMALLGWLGAHGLPASVPRATGAAGPRILGAFTPGAGPLRLPEPRPAPTGLRMNAG